VVHDSLAKEVHPIPSVVNIVVVGEVVEVATVEVDDRQCKLRFEFHLKGGVRFELRHGQSSDERDEEIVTLDCMASTGSSTVSSRDNDATNTPLHLVGAGE
jgi:hypothetical protein